MKLPFACELYSDGREVENPFSNEKCYLTADALSVYDVIKGSEALEDYATVGKVLIGFKNIIQKNI